MNLYWDTLKKDPDFDSFYRDIKTLRQEDQDFKEALSHSSKEYAQRPSRKKEDQHDSQSTAARLYENSSLFLMEECAVLRVLAKDNHNLAIVYPGAVTKILDRAIQYINRNGRENNPFHWLYMQKKNTKNKTISSCFFKPGPSSVDPTSSSQYDVTTTYLTPGTSIQS